MEPETVAEYFENALGADIETLDGPDSDNSMERMPLASICGHECRRAIDAARALLDFVERATGEDRPERNRAVQVIALQCCLVFING